jgi:hypothetical protein
VARVSLTNGTLESLKRLDLFNETLPWLYEEWRARLSLQEGSAQRGHILRRLASPSTRAFLSRLEKEVVEPAGFLTHSDQSTQKGPPHSGDQTFR